MTNPIINPRNGMMDFNVMKQLEVLHNEILFDLPENQNWKITSYGRLVRVNKEGKINYSARLDFTNKRSIVKDNVIPPNLTGKRPEFLLALIDNITIYPDTVIKYKDKNPNNMAKDNLIFYSESNKDNINAAKMELEDYIMETDPEILKALEIIKNKKGLSEALKIIQMEIKANGGK